MTAFLNLFMLLDSKAVIKYLVQYYLKQNLMENYNFNYKVNFKKYKLDTSLFRSSLCKISWHTLSTPFLIFSICKYKNFASNGPIRIIVSSNRKKSFC